MNRTVGFIIQGVPLDLKRAIAAAAADRETNMNDVIVSLLAERFKVPFEPTGRPSSTRPSDSPDILIREPKRLRSRIKAAADEADSSSRDVIVAVLSEAFGTRFAPNGRGRRGRPSGASRATTPPA